MAMSDEERKIRRREYERKYRATHKERIRLKIKAWRLANKEKVGSQRKAYYQKIKDDPIFKAKAKARSRKWAMENKPRKKITDYLYHKKIQQDPVLRAKSLAQSKQADKRASVTLTDGYVRRIITSHNSLSTKGIPQSLVNAKRSHLKCLRLIKEQENV